MSCLQLSLGVGGPRAPAHLFGPVPSPALAAAALALDALLLAEVGGSHCFTS